MNPTLSRNLIRNSTIINPLTNRRIKFGRETHLKLLNDGVMQLSNNEAKYFIYDPVNNKIYINSKTNIKNVNERINIDTRKRVLKQLATEATEFNRRVLRQIIRPIGRTGNRMVNVFFQPRDNLNNTVRDILRYINANIEYGDNTNTPNLFQIGIVLTNGTTYTSSFVIYEGLRFALAELLRQIEEGGDYYEDIDDDSIASVYLSYYINSDIVVGRGGDAAVDITDKYFNISIPTLNRCGFKTVFMACNPNLTFKQLNDMSCNYIKRVFKRKYPDYDSNGITFQQLNEVAIYKGVNLNIYDNNYNLVMEFNNDFDNTISVKYHDNHYTPMISKVFEFSTHSFAKYLINQQNKTDDYEIIELPEHKREYIFNPNFMSYDIETFINDNNQHQPYAIALAWHNLTEYNDKVTEYNKEEKQVIKHNKTIKENFKNEIIRFNKKEIKTFPKKVPLRTNDLPIPTINKTELFDLPIDHVMYYGTDCIAQFADYLYDHSFELNNKYLYAHNGAKFDLNIILEQVLIHDHRFTITKCIDLNNSFISLKLKFNDCCITFLDSCRQFPGSLHSFCSEMNTPIRKLTGVIDHKTINVNNFNNDDISSSIKRYLFHDVASLLQSMDAYACTIWDSYKINIVKCLTSASLSKHLFFQNYNSAERPIYYLPKSVDQYIRNSYYGGRCEVFRHGDYTGKFYYYDFTSLYPAAATKDLPYDKPEFVQQININDFYGFVRCMVRTTSKDFIPLHGIKINNTLNFPYFDNWTELTLFSEEIKKSISLGLPYEYQFIDGYKFKSAPILRDFMTTAFKAKNDAKKAGNNALSQASKIIANSGYGFFGLRTTARDGIKIIRDDDITTIDSLISAGSMLNFENKGNYIISRVRQDMDCKTYNVSVASAITSLARCMLYDALNDIQEQGGKLYYCDTDSIITDFQIEESVLMSKYMPNYGSELGELKNEYVDKYAKVARKLGGDYANTLHFDRLIIQGCKFYACRGNILNTNVDIVKCKGLKESDNVYINEEVRDFDFDTFARFNGQVFYQNQTQGFNCSATCKLNDWRITTRNIVKKFTKVYNKGYFNENGTVTPLTL